jgi:hypothetical protein
LFDASIDPSIDDISDKMEILSGFAEEFKLCTDSFLPNPCAIRPYFHVLTNFLAAWLNSGQQPKRFGHLS